MDWKTLLRPVRLDRGTGNDRLGEFQSDYARVIFSTPFRRLHDKAQVFPLESLDTVRTRLTHSLEVAIAARGIAIRVGKLLEADQRIEPEESQCIQEIAATCAVVHDLGNPPFGHAGEEAIQLWFKDFGQANRLTDAQEREDLTNFEGNAQTIRLLTRLQLLGRRNLDLTVGTLSAARKYIARSDQVGTPEFSDKQGYKKPGHFKSENPQMKEVEEATGTAGSRNPISLMVEAADDIVYSVVDVEDAIRKGLASWAEFADHVKHWSGGAASELFQSIVNQCVTSFECAEPTTNSRSSEEFIQIYRIYFVRHCLNEVAKAFDREYTRIMEGRFHGELYESSGVAGLVNASKSCAKKFVYPTGDVLRLEIRGKTIIHGLMESFHEAVVSGDVDRLSVKSFPDKAFKLLSDNYRSVYREDTASGAMSREYCQKKLVADYVAGMTDSFASDLYRDLFQAR